MLFMIFVFIFPRNMDKVEPKGQKIERHPVYQLRHQSKISRPYRKERGG